jgi:hypothetical protein
MQWRGSRAPPRQPPERGTQTRPMCRQRARPERRSRRTISGQGGGPRRRGMAGGARTSLRRRAPGPSAATSRSRLGPSPLRRPGTAVSSRLAAAIGVGPETAAGHARRTRRRCRRRRLRREPRRTQVRRLCARPRSTRWSPRIRLRGQRPPRGRGRRGPGPRARGPKPRTGGAPTLRRWRARSSATRSAGQRPSSVGRTERRAPPGPAGAFPCRGTSRRLQVRPRARMRHPRRPGFAVPRRRAGSPETAAVRHPPTPRRPGRASRRARRPASGSDRRRLARPSAGRFDRPHRSCRRPQSGRGQTPVTGRAGRQQRPACRACERQMHRRPWNRLRRAAPPRQRDLPGRGPRPTPRPVNGPRRP